MEHPSSNSHVGEKPYEGYAPLPTTDDQQQPPPYASLQPAGYPPQTQYEGGYQNQGYPPQGQGYQNQGGPPQGQLFPPQGSGYIQQPGGYSSQNYNSTTVVVQVSRIHTRRKN